MLMRAVLRLGCSHRGGSPLSTGGQHWWVALSLRHHITLFLVGVRTRALVVIERDSAFLRRCLLIGAFRDPLLREECLDLLVEHNAHIYDEKEHDDT